tara:strand:- start:236 stop:706 length:471 start_codon:yes stop_codon:yes gene_type:complete
MSNLRLIIEEKYKIALKEKYEVGIRTFRLIKSAIKEKEILLRSEKSKKELSDEDIIKLLQSLIKQRNESVEMYKKAGRDKLVEGELKEIEIINEFLPQQLNEEEIKKIIEKYVKDHNISSVSQMGLLMNYLKSNYMTVVDMSVAGKLAKDIINKKN